MITIFTPKILIKILNNYNFRSKNESYETNNNFCAKNYSKVKGNKSFITIFALKIKLLAPIIKDNNFRAKKKIKTKREKNGKVNPF